MRTLTVRDCRHIREDIDPEVALLQMVAAASEDYTYKQLLDLDAGEVLPLRAEMASQLTEYGAVSRELSGWRFALAHPVGGNKEVLVRYPKWRDRVESKRGKVSMVEANARFIAMLSSWSDATLTLDEVWGMAFADFANIASTIDGYLNSG